MCVQDMDVCSNASVLKNSMQLKKKKRVIYYRSAKINVVSLTEKESRDLMRVTLLCQIRTQMTQLPPHLSFQSVMSSYYTQT